MYEDAGSICVKVQSFSVFLFLILALLVLALAFGIFLNVDTGK